MCSLGRIEARAGAGEMSRLTWRQGTPKQLHSTAEQGMRRVKALHRLSWSIHQPHKKVSAMPELDAMLHCALFCAVPLLLKHQPEISVTEQRSVMWGKW